MLAPRPTRLPSNRRDRTPVLVPARRAATRMRPPYFCVVLPSLLAFRPSLGVKSSSGMATLLSLAIRKREWRISAMREGHVSRPFAPASQEKYVQTNPYAMSRDTAFILFPLSSLLPTLPADRKRLL